MISSSSGEDTPASRRPVPLRPWACLPFLLCLNFAMVSNMPCNPSIGGSAKGIVVREIDALGGIMGKMADMKGSLLQMKVLNTSKGPGVRCLRAQEDKRGYPRNVQNYLLTIPDWISSKPNVPGS